MTRASWSSRVRVCAAACVMAAVGTASAHFAMPTDLPVSRVITNLEAKANEKPSAAAYLNLARAHAYAFSHGTGMIPVLGGDDMRVYEIGYSPSRPSGPMPPIGEKMTREQALEHLRAGVRAFNEAIKLDRRDAVAVYGLACLLEAGQSMAGEVGVMPMVDVQPVSEWNARSAESLVRTLAERDATDEEIGLSSERSWSRDRERPRALAWALVRARSGATGKHLERINATMARLWSVETYELYFEAFCLGLPEDSGATEKGILHLNSYVSYQAAEDYSRVVPTKYNYPVRKATIAAAMKAFEKLPPCGAITPIVVPLEGHVDASGDVPIEHLLARDVRVKFDLDGTGRDQTWSWVLPRGGLLCWDPSNRGTISGGMQLFGSATWWLLFEDGYAAMDALDDDRDGVLTGRELDGLSLWVDANTNGVSEPGEVKPLATFNITRLSTRADKSARASDGHSLVCEQGVTFASGRVAPTYDWVTTPMVGNADRDAAAASIGASGKD